MKFFKKLASFFMALVMAFGIIPLAKCTEVVGGADETKKVAQMQPKVSVIIPVYKVEPYLRKCMDSVVNQTLKDIEIICVDDGSPDNCGKILDEYAAKDSRIKVIHQENKGLPMARQAGLDIATGEYIKFVDSDDYIDLRTLEICYNEAKKDDVDILIHGHYRFNHLHTWKVGRLKKNIFQANRWRPTVGYVWMSFINRRVILRSGVSYRSTRNLCEDQCFFMQLWPCTQRVKTISDVLYYYRRYANQMTRRVRYIARACDHLQNITVIYRHWKKQGWIKNSDAQVGFLDKALSLNFWPRSSTINKMFYDTLNSLDANLIRDKRVISRLSKQNKAKLAAIMKFAEPANKKQAAAQKRKPAPKKHSAHRRARRR